MHISQKNLWRISMLYIYIPVLIMMIGWSSLWFSISAALLSLIAVKIVLKSIKTDKVLFLNKTEVILCCGIIFFMAYYSGWGGIAPQAKDWHKHNAILRDLIFHPWPVIYKNHGIISMLTYYLGQYMVPSVIGKLFLKLAPAAIADYVIFYIAEVAMAVWNMIGLGIILCHVQILVPHKSKIVLMIAFLLFGNPLLLSKMLYNCLGLFSDTDVGNYHWMARKNLIAQYATNYPMLRWVFPQCIVPWIVTSMLLEGETDMEAYMVIGLPVILFSTFPFLGIAVNMAALGLHSLYKSKNIKLFLSKCFSIQNIFASLSVGTFSFFYFISYFLAEGKPDILKLQFVFEFNRKFIVTYIIFCLGTFGLYAILLLIYERRNVSLNTAILTLLILPLFKLGLNNDLVMRASIPALFILCVYALRRLFCTVLPEYRKCKYILLVLYIIGIYYPVRELGDVIEADNMYDFQERADSYETLERYANPSIYELEPEIKIGKDIIWNYYTYYADENCVFLKTIGKKSFQLQD